MTLTQKQINHFGLCWYSDPGHGWLSVTMQAVIDAGVAGQISTCSYMSKGGHVAYLEEDCDTTRFLDAIGFDRQGEASIPEKMPVRGHSFVRRLPTYISPPPTPEQALRALVVAHDEQPPMITKEHWQDARRSLDLGDPVS